MSTRIVVDPVTRIEGHLRIEAEIENGIIQDAFSSGTMVRGIEIIVQDRDPREVWAYVGRVCGVCTSIHSLCSVRAVENALGIVIPPNAEMVRNLMQGALLMHDHVVHFYQLQALDWVDGSTERHRKNPNDFRREKSSPQLPRRRYGLRLKYQRPECPES